MSELNVSNQRVVPSPNSMATFASGLLEAIILEARSTELMAIVESDGSTTLKVGDREFQAPSSVEAYRLLWHWLDQKDKASDFSEYEEAGKLVEAEEEQRQDKMIDDITKGGMSELGQETERLRQERRETIVASVMILTTEDPLFLEGSIENIITKVREHCGLMDIEVEELLYATESFK